MKALSTKNEIQQLINDFRKSVKTSEIETNFYGFINKGNQVYILNDHHGVFFLEKCELTKQYCYYFFTNCAGLVNAGFSLPKSANYKCEYLVNCAASNSVILHLSNLGFEKYANLRKMSRINIVLSLNISVDIKKCEITDLSYLRDVFDNKFDSVSERLPSDSEIIEALNSGNIYKVTDTDKILGFYWADTKKFLSELRYIFIDEDARGRSLGEMLLQHFLVRSSTVKKNQLWVLEGNTPALKLYEKYGFNFERMYDYIFKVEK